MSFSIYQTTCRRPFQISQRSDKNWTVARYNPDTTEIEQWGIFGTEALARDAAASINAELARAFSEGGAIPIPDDPRDAENETRSKWIAAMDEVLALGKENARLRDELKKWQAGGVTEELLRAHDGCIRIGRGCDIAIVRAEDWDRLHADLADARATFDDLAGRTAKP